jgi:hypothetical protein
MELSGVQFGDGIEDRQHAFLDQPESDLFLRALKSRHQKLGLSCPLLAQNGHCSCRNECPLSGVKRTSKTWAVMSAYDPKRTSADVATCPLLQDSSVHPFQKEASKIASARICVALGCSQLERQPPF